MGCHHEQWELRPTIMLSAEAAARTSRILSEHCTGEQESGACIAANPAAQHGPAIPRLQSRDLNGSCTTCQAVKYIYIFDSMRTRHSKFQSTATPSKYSSHSPGNSRFFPYILHIASFLSRHVAQFAHSCKHAKHGFRPLKGRVNTPLELLCRASGWDPSSAC